MTGWRPGSSPPRLASAIVRRLPAPDNAFVAGDLAEEFEHLVESQGVRAARRWYWKQVCLSVAPLVRRRISTFIAARRRRRSALMLYSLLADLRYASRIARRAPAVTLAVVLAIALGIAASTAIFSVVESVFLKPLPFPHPERLVRLGTVIEGFGQAPEVNFLDAGDWRAASSTIEALGQYDVEDETARTEDASSRTTVTVMSITAEMSAVLGVQPRIGRDFAREEHQWGGPAAALLGHRFWRTHFGGDSSVAGRRIQIGTTWYRIVGVLPEQADRFPTGGADLWRPLRFPSDSFLNLRGSIALGAIGRLKPGVTIDAARQELATISARLATTYPDTNARRRAVVNDLQQTMVGPVRPMLLLLAGSIAALLTVACVNIANLLLAQAYGRRLEFGIRAAVGASRARLVAQCWTETLLLFGLGGALGVAGALPLARGLIATYPDALPLAQPVQLDLRVLLVAIAVTLGAAMLAAVPLARRTRAAGVGADLQAGQRSGLFRSHRRTTAVFVAAQVALSMVLLFGGILLLRTFVTLTRITPGFDADHVVSINASIPDPPGGGATATADLQDRLRDTARSLPGVADGAHAMFIPFAPGTWGDGYRRTGIDEKTPQQPLAHFFMVSPEYLRVMGLPILRGRGLAASDTEHSPGVLVVSETFARRAFPGRDVVGRRIDWNDGTWEIVGVTADARHETLWEPADADVYVPRRQVVRSNTWLLLETDRPPDAILGELEERARRIDPDIALSDARTMRQRLENNAAPERFRAIVTGALAAITLVLAVVGLHGVVSYAVAQRTREIGVRLALGQPPASVVAAIVRDTLRPIAAGAIPGILASIYAGRWLASIAIVHGRLGGALVGVLVIFVAAAIVAAAGPARRASRVDPVVALRAQ